MVTQTIPITNSSRDFSSAEAPEGVWKRRPYAESRRAVEADIVPENRLDVEPVKATSPSGKYSIEISRYRSPGNPWKFSRGVVTDEDGALIADVKRKPEKK